MQERFKQVGLDGSSDARLQEKVAKLFVEAVSPMGEAQLRVQTSSPPPGVLARLVSTTRIFVRVKDLRALSATVLAGMLTDLVAHDSITGLAVSSVVAIGRSVAVMSDDQLMVIRAMQEIAVTDSIYESWFAQEAIIDALPAGWRSRGLVTLAEMKSRRIVEEAGGMWKVIL